MKTIDQAYQSLPNWVRDAIGPITDRDRDYWGDAVRGGAGGVEKTVKAGTVKGQAAKITVFLHPEFDTPLYSVIAAGAERKVAESKVGDLASMIQ